MRDALAALDGQRLTVQAAVRRQGRRIGWAGIGEPTICLGPIVADDGALLADHVWLPLGKRLAALALRPGDTIRFRARVGTYRRGLKRLPDGTLRFSREFTLLYPARITLIARAPNPAPVQAPVPKPKPPVPPPGPCNRERILAALDGLRGRPEPVGLVRLLVTLPMPPISAITLLRAYAQQGIVVFTPDGGLRVPPMATTERSI